MISVKNLNKTFRISKRDKGLKAAAKSLFKRKYTTIEALSDINFHINKGEMVGYIGPNGAGKSTTIKIMCGILNPDNGECIIDGFIPWKERKEYVKRIGVVFGQRSQLWWDIPVIDSFDLIKDIYSVYSAQYKNNIDELTHLLDLKEILKTPTRQLSLGQRMRCEVAASLIHNPDILFLDEPTIGLDAVSKIAVRNFIKKINQQKKTTVILTTHDMQDIEAITERVILIGKGKILLDGNLKDIKKEKLSEKIISIEYSSGTFKKTEGLLVKNEAEGILTIAVDSNKISVSNAISYLSQTLDITDISVSDISTDDLVVSLYKEFKI